MNKTYVKENEFIIDTETGEMKLINVIDNRTEDYDGTTDFDTLYNEIKELAESRIIPGDVPDKFKRRYGH